VLRVTGAPKAYAACLTSLAEHRMGRPGMALSLGALGRESELGQRVGRILRFGEWMQPAQARVVMCVAILGLLGGASELARCPQVIGFSAAHPGGSQIAAGVAPMRAANGFGYQAVVFRPDQALAAMRQVPTHRDSTAMNGAPGVLAVRKQTFGSNGLIHRGMDARGAQWLVVTSWSEMDGSRMVLTTMSVPDAAAASLGASERSTEGGSAHEAQDAQQEVHRYAAVPVRGGWLVFQL